MHKVTCVTETHNKKYSNESNKLCTFFFRYFSSYITVLTAVYFYYRFFACTDWIDWHMPVRIEIATSIRRYVWKYSFNRMATECEYRNTGKKNANMMYMVFYIAVMLFYSSLKFQGHAYEHSFVHAHTTHSFAHTIIIIPLTKLFTFYMWWIYASEFPANDRRALFMRSQAGSFFLYVYKFLLFASFFSFGFFFLIRFIATFIIIHCLRLFQLFWQT